MDHIFISVVNVGFGFDQHLHHFGVTQGSSGQNEALVLHNATDTTMNADTSVIKTEKHNRQRRIV